MTRSRPRPRSAGFAEPLRRLLRRSSVWRLWLPDLGFRYILNTAPGPGEAAEYRVEYPAVQSEPTREYALVSMIPGLDDGKKLLLISGLNTQATQMATEFLTDPTHLTKLVARLHRVAPGRKGPWYFQAVLRTEVRDKVPTAGAELVTVRVLQ